MSETEPSQSGSDRKSSQVWQSGADARRSSIRHLSAKPEGLPFSERLVGVVAHPEVVSRGPSVKYRILGKRLHSYNRFTSILELRAIVPACADIGFGETPFGVEKGMALQAMEIAHEETDHARSAEILISELTEVSGVEPGRHRTPEFLSALSVARKTTDRKQRALARHSFACISETLITGTLSKVPQDKTVIPEVRDIISEHAHDEALHHRYFSKLMGDIWMQLDEGERDYFGPMLAEWIVKFLAVDRPTETDWLTDSGFGREEARRIVNETHEATDLRQIMRNSAKPTLIQMRRIGMLEHAKTFDALGSHGLV